MDFNFDCRVNLAVIDGEVLERGTRGLLKCDLLLFL